MVERMLKPQCMHPNVEVSVLLAVWNGGATLLPSVRSILNQTFERFELLIIDDESTDDSLRLIDSFRDSRIKLLINPHNMGLAASLNRGIDAAAGRYIARMDIDDIAYPDRLEKQWRYLDQHRDVDLLGTGALMFRGQGHCVGVMPSVLGHSDILRLGLLGSFPLYHPTWMGRAEWFRRHRYDASFRKSEDYELLLRAASTSKYENLPEILLAYRYELSGSLRKRLEYRRHTWFAMQKNFLATRDWAALIRGGAVAGAKASRDLLFSLRVGGSAVEVSRVMRASVDELRRWSQVLEQVSVDSIPTFLERS